ncbi:hypothetical protein L2750_13915 [Shewanella submarina]|uniref:Uncharacterized protein n=1 Tax=Shewanella submarina TaxID=2016376 RepID=A0ABV7GGL7_9GAMM|nr:hypothetical protein [Shewanella submarina]MCL1038240.1 hypothetical protein [Shewanella submarina]
MLEAQEAGSIIMDRKWIPMLIILMWFSQAASTSLKNMEYDGIVSSMVDSPIVGSCHLVVQTTRQWPFSWTIRKAVISLTKNDISLSSTTSKYQKPDRFFLKSHDTKFHFTWSESQNEKLVASYLDVEINPSGTIESVNMGYCPDYTETTELIGYLEQCNVPIEVIKCT